MLTIPHCKESLSRAYITAVVGRSRNNLWWKGEYDYGVDGGVRALEQHGDRIRETGLGFDFQSKTTVDWQQDGNEIVYDLEAKTYNDLAARAGTSALPMLLIVLCLHGDENTWLAVSPNELILQRCAFWFKVEGGTTENGDSKRVRIPDANVFSPDAVTNILQQIKDGAMLP